MRLTIELVPSTCWFSNVRSSVTPAEWDRIKSETRTKAGSKCEICGGVGPQWPVECHEVWRYDDKIKLQKLERFIALCPSCHEVKHIGFATKRGRGEIAEAHFCKVNGVSRGIAKKYISEAFATWSERSRYEWELDIKILEDMGITPKDDGQRGNYE